jgi:glycosyltransferase involved in cell wall biosynthesis
MDELRGKRILYVITKSNWGGAQTYVHALALHAKEQGAEVAVAVGGAGLPGSDTGILAARLAESGVRTIALPSLARDIFPLHEWRALRELTELIRRERPTVLHLNSSKAGVLGSVAGRRARVPHIVFTVHGWPHRESRSPLWRTAARLGSWLTILLAHAVIAVSACDLRTAPVLLSRRKITVVHNGIPDFSLLTREEARQFLAPTLAPLKKLSKWLILPAELSPNKGIDLAIRAFAGVSTNIDDAALVIVGEGDEHQELSDLIASYGLEERAFLVGFVPDVRRYLSAANAFLMPSRKEGFPIALLEAGQAGLPLVAAAVGGIPEVIEHGKNGLLIRPGDIDGLADAMTRLLTDTGEAARLGVELKKTVSNKFSEEEMITKTVRVYNKEKA